MKLKTVQQVAIERGTSQQNVRNLKSIEIVDCPVFAMYKGKYFEVGKQKFVVQTEK